MTDNIKRSFVIPVLDFSPHGPYNIRTLLNDLAEIEGEVICIFNSEEVFNELGGHGRIDKYCYNKMNAGVSRSWNLGIDMAEGDAVFIMNADLHVEPSAIDEIESYLYSLDKAVIVGPQGSIIDFRRMTDVRYYSKGTFSKPVACDAISGFMFAINRALFMQHNLSFDVRYSPCFFEEWDMGLQIKMMGLSCYAVPVCGFEHEWGVSQAEGERIINYFGKELRRNDILLSNREKFIQKWRAFVDGTGSIKAGKKEIHENGMQGATGTWSFDPSAGIQRLLDFIDRTQEQAYSEGLSELHSQITGQMLSGFFDRYQLPKGAAILDIGCGQGPALDIFNQLGYRATGVTISEEDVRVCRNKGHDVLKMDQSFLSFPDSSFDMLWVRHCLEHSIFPFFTLTEFFRVMNAGAFLYLEVPAPNTACHHENNINHYSVLSKEMWVSLIARTGFALLEGIDLSFETAAGPDVYWAFICRKQAEAI